MSSLKHILGCAFLIASASILGCSGSEEPNGALNPFEKIDVSMETMTGPCAAPLPDGTCPHNGLTPACFWDHSVQKALRDLANGAIWTASHELPWTETLPYPDMGNQCRETILRDLIGCALPSGDSLYDANAGDTYYGYFGLAPSWKTGAPTENEERWVTACLAQHINGLDAEVPIMLGGNNSAFSANLAASSNFPLRESTAYGNLFASTVPLNPKLPGGSPAFTLYVCSDNTAVWNGCDYANATDFLDDRVCDGATNPCGLSFVGACSSSCLKSGGKNGYWSCGTYSQTVTVSVPNACYWLND